MFEYRFLHSKKNVISVDVLSDGPEEVECLIVLDNQDEIRIHVTQDGGAVLSSYELVDALGPVRSDTDTQNEPS